VPANTLHLQGSNSCEAVNPAASAHAVSSTSDDLHCTHARVDGPVLHPQAAAAAAAAVAAATADVSMSFCISKHTP